jgi:endonuclease V-like protein UPF0215 family
LEPRRLSHTLAFDDAPLSRAARGPVRVVGTAYAHLRLEGERSLSVTRDGSDATAGLAAAIARSKFGRSVKVVLLQGLALAGFNVVDIHGLTARLGVPVRVVMRRPPRRIPAPLRVAHLIAVGVTTGESRGRA